MSTGHLIHLVVIMIACGAIGGIASYFASEIPPEESSPVVKRIALGIAAAFVVPLFLNMISSSILVDSEQSRANSLVFAGLCIVAAFSSKALLETVSKKILDKVQSVEQKQQDLEAEIEPLIAKETEPQPNQQAVQFDVEVREDELAVLRALANRKYARRYVSGVASEAGISDVRAVYLLTTLKEKNLVASKRGKQLDLFWITSLGRDYLRSSEKTATSG